MVVRVCVALCWTVLLAKSCVAGEELPTLLVKEASAYDPQDSSLNRSKVIQDSTEKITTTSCAPPLDLQSLITAPPWLPILFAESASRLLADKQCGKDAQRFLNELAAGNFWAARMFDASTRIPEGVLFGQKLHYGNFDGCYNGGTDDFGTRYCLIDLEYKQSSTFRHNHTVYYDIAANNCTWDFLKVKPYIWALDRSSLRMALCAPFSCTAKDIELCLAKGLADHFLKTVPTVDTPFSISVRPSKCQALKEHQDSTLGGQIFWGLFAVLCTLIGVATWRYQPKTQGQEKLSLTSSILECFALQWNIKNLVQRNSDQTLTILDTMRVAMTFYFILGHRYMHYVFIPAMNPEYSDIAQQSWWYIAVTNSNCMVDMAFCITAILATKAWLEKLERGESLQFWKIALRRYIRFTPSYAFVIFFYISVLPYIGSGALWPTIVEAEAKLCHDTWWQNLLYINNYTEKPYCMFQSWHLATDMQVHIVLFLVVMVFWKLPRRVKYQFLIFLIMASGSLAAYVTYAKQFPPTLQFFHLDRRNSLLYEDLRNIDYLQQFYVKTHLRISPFFVGVAAGAMIVKFKKTDRRFPELWSIVTLILAVLGKFAIHALLARYVWNVASDLEVLLYAGFHRTIYAVLSAVIIIVLAFGENLKWLRDLLSPAWISVLNKLNYGIYICHHINQMYDHGALRTSKVLSYYNLLSDFLRDSCFAVAFSLILWLAIESPVQHLLQLFLERRLVARRNKAD